MYVCKYVCMYVYVCIYIYIYIYICICVYIYIYIYHIVMFLLIRILTSKGRYQQRLWAKDLHNTYSKGVTSVIKHKFTGLL